MPSEKQGMVFEVKIFDSKSGELIEDINYNVLATQEGTEVLKKFFVHENLGIGQHVTSPLISDNPVDIQIGLRGTGNLAPISIIDELVELTIPENFEDDSIKSPKKQIANGVSPENVKCIEGLELLLSHNDRPGCFFQSSVEKLTERGWIKMGKV